jgi:asparaginyl-tRNA synthetase
MDFKHISEVTDKSFEGKKTALRGWIHRHRAGKDVVFFTLRDASGLIQCAVKKENPQFAEADKLGIESCITLEGIVREEQRAPGKFEIVVEKFTIVGPSQNYPISKDLSEEFLLDVRHLWVRSQKMVNILKVRAVVFEAIREYFNKNGFYEVHTPFFTQTSESALEMFETDYFGKKARLGQTGQFYLETLLPALEKVYVIGPSFRAEKSKTARHLTEYWHAEPEVAWCDLDGIIKVAEELVSHICQKVAKECRKELTVLGRNPADLERIKPPFPRITYEDAIEKLDAKGIEVTWGKDLRTPEEKAIADMFEKPVFITHYPKEIMAFYKPAEPKNPKTARCFDLIAPEVGVEIIGGSERDTNIKEMEKALREKGDDPKNYGWYFDTRRYGAVPHSGFGLGVERIIQWICKLDSIKDAIPFPRTIERLAP